MPLDARALIRLADSRTCSTPTRHRIGGGLQGPLRLIIPGEEGKASAKGGGGLPVRCACWLAEVRTTLNFKAFGGGFVALPGEKGGKKANPLVGLRVHNVRPVVNINSCNAHGNARRRRARGGPTLGKVSQRGGL